MLSSLHRERPFPVHIAADIHQTAAVPVFPDILQSYQDDVRIIVVGKHQVYLFLGIVRRIQYFDFQPRPLHNGPGNIILKGMALIFIENTKEGPLFLRFRALFRPVHGLLHRPAARQSQHRRA